MKAMIAHWYSPVATLRRVKLIVAVNTGQLCPALPRVRLRIGGADSFEFGRNFRRREVMRFWWLLSHLNRQAQRPKPINSVTPGVVKNFALPKGTGGGSIAQDISKIEFSN